VRGAITRIGALNTSCQNKNVPDFKNAALSCVLWPIKRLTSKGSRNGVC